MKRTYAQGITTCAGTCNRPTRSSHHTLEQHPGTVARYAAGMCHTCYKNSGTKAGKPARPKVARCLNCDHLTRAQGITKAQAPGTRQRVGDLCRQCDSAGTFVPPEEVRGAAESLAAYLRARRARGVPPEGLGALELAA